VSRRRPTLLFVSDALEVPPRHGYHVHLLSLARAASAYVPTRIFAWSDSPGAHEDESEYLTLLSRQEAPSGNLRRKWRYLSRALEWFEEAAAPGSVIWVRSYATALLLIPRLSALRRRVAKLRTVYDAASFLRLEARHAPFGRLYGPRGFIEERLWPHFDVVRTLNDPMRDYLVSRGVRRERVFVLPVGSPEPGETWATHGEPSRLLYVGSGMEWQGLSELLEAMRRLQSTHPRARLTVVGVRAEEMGNGAAPPNVEFRGPIAHADVAETYLAHDVLVLPRPRSPLTEIVLPMKVPEAMAYGMPIVATDLAAVRWMTGEEGAILAPANDPASLATALGAALDDPERLRRIGAAARARAREYTWHRLGERIRDELFATPAE
jgi:glycosyltransferase involved in cell wall biosynthesis